jgi:hypothetical protein
MLMAIERSFAVAEKKVELPATPAAPPPEPAAVRPLEPKLKVPSTFSMAALKESKVWTSERRIRVSAIVLFPIVLLLLALAGFLMRPSHQAANQGNQPALQTQRGYARPLNPN